MPGYTTERAECATVPHDISYRADDSGIRYVCQECLPPSSRDHSRRVIVVKRCPIHGSSWHRVMAWSDEGWLENYIGRVPVATA
jgi:hypothetical protein